MVTSTGAEVVLTDGQLREYAERGFLALDAITSEAEVRRLRGTYDRLFEPGALVADRDRVELAGRAERSLPQVLNPDHYAPELLETVAYRNAAALARQLLGERSGHMGMHAIRKPARSAVETPWHQDEAYWDPAYRHGALSIWIPLQPATADNGCMHFLPGSHREGVRPHQLIDPASADGLRLADGQLVSGGVACPVSAGGATVHAARTLHYTGPNHTDEPRRALIIAFRVPPVREGTRSFPWQPAAWYE
jgi:hypothetical protein